jgi:hypothetical protein
VACSNLKNKNKRVIVHFPENCEARKTHSSYDKKIL